MLAMPLNFYGLHPSDPSSNSTPSSTLQQQYNIYQQLDPTVPSNIQQSYYTHSEQSVDVKYATASSTSSHLASPISPCSQADNISPCSSRNNSFGMTQSSSPIINPELRKLDNNTKNTTSSKSNMSSKASSPITFFISPSGSIYFLSNSSQRILGYDPKKLVGTSFLEYLFNDNLELCVQNVRNSVMSGTRFEMNLYFKHGSLQEYVPLLIKGFAIFDNKWSSSESVNANINETISEIDSLVQNYSPTQDDTRTKACGGLIIIAFPLSSNNKPQSLVSSFPSPSPSKDNKTSTLWQRRRVKDSTSISQEVNIPASNNLTVATNIDASMGTEAPNNSGFEASSCPPSAVSPHSNPLLNSMSHSSVQPSSSASSNYFSYENKNELILTKGSYEDMSILQNTPGTTGNNNSAILFETSQNSLKDKFEFNAGIKSIDDTNNNNNANLENPSIKNANINENAINSNGTNDNSNTDISSQNLLTSQCVASNIKSQTQNLENPQITYKLQHPSFSEQNSSSSHLLAHSPNSVSMQQQPHSQQPMAMSASTQQSQQQQQLPSNVDAVAPPSTAFWNPAYVVPDSNSLVQQDFPPLVTYQLANPTDSRQTMQNIQMMHFNTATQPQSQMRGTSLSATTPPQITYQNTNLYTPQQQNMVPSNTNSSPIMDPSAQISTSPNGIPASSMPSNSMYDFQRVHFMSAPVNTTSNIATAASYSTPAYYTTGYPTGSIPASYMGHPNLRSPYGNMPNSMPYGRASLGSIGAMGHLSALGGMATTAGKRKSRYQSYDRTGFSGHVCTECHVEESPEWRKGPKGPKTLCNACGLRWAKKFRKENMKNSTKSEQKKTQRSVSTGEYTVPPQQQLLPSSNELCSSTNVNATSNLSMGINSNSQQLQQQPPQ